MNRPIMNRPMMTRQHYRFLAGSIKNMKLTPLNKIFVAEHLADDLAMDNPNFKREVFLEWCGVLG